MGSEGRAIESEDDLLDWFRAGEKPLEDYRVGTEHEKIGLYEDDYRRHLEEKYL